MPFIVIPSADVDQGSVIDESLMSGKIKNDLDDLDARLSTLEALSGGGGVAAAFAEDLFAEIIAGGEDNIAKFWKVRHHVMMNTTGLGVNAEGLDFEEKEKHERFFHDPNFTIVSSMQSNVQAYLSNVFFIEQNEQIQFRIKKGENFFCIGTYLALAAATVWRVYVDGVNVNTVGLVDENDALVPAQFSSNNATTQYGKLFHFYGLDGEEHVITIKNENATALEIPFQYIDIGYRSPMYAIDHTVKVKAGAANIGGIAADFNEGEYTFTKPGIGLANGYTGMLKINQQGVITAAAGLSPASTQLKPNVAVAFSGGAVASLAVKNHWHFPDYGIAMFSHPSGEQYFFSYSSKTQPGGPASQTFAGIMWQAQPREDFTPLVPSAGATYVTNEWRGDGRIEYWARPPIEISGTNNKIDFEITIDGVETSHTATITSGWYAADIIRIGKAVVDAMKVAKPLPVHHEYFCEYNALSQLWTIGTRGARISKINFRWATGANSGSDFGVVIGFTSDIIDATSYLSPSIKQHLAQRVFVADDNIRSSEHPSIKYTWAASSTVLVAEADSALETSNLSSYRRQDSSATRVYFNIYPDEDCAGMSLTFMREDIGVYLTYSIDDGDEVYLLQTDRPADVAAPTRGALMHAFISFPKGSRKITIKAELNTWFEVEASTQFTTFFGYRQFFTKPPWELLMPTEKILKVFEVNPIRLFATAYGHNTALYTPQPSDDNINSITESGVWLQVTATSTFNARHRSTVTNGGYVEVEFVLAGDGGGIGIRRFDTTDTSQEVSFYLAAGAITEATDLIDRGSFDWLASQYKKDWQHLGLPAGTYRLRMKNDHTQRMINGAIIVYDTVVPQVGARVLSEVNNTGQSVSWPINVRRRECSRYQAFRQPSYFAEGNYKRGIVHHGDYVASTHNILNRDESGDVIEESDAWWLYQGLTNSGEYTGYRTFCRSLSFTLGHFSTDVIVNQPTLDGRTLNTFSAREEVKGGFAPTATRRDNAVAVFNNFESVITFSAGLVYNMTDTRGLRTGQKILLTDGTSFEEAHIASFVTDVSFTLAKALTVLTDSAVNKVFFWGFHNLRITTGDANDTYHSAYVFEPLPLEESVIGIRVQSEKREEIVSFTQALATTGADVNQNFEYPIHSDGEQAIPNTVEILHLRNSLASNVTLNRGLKTIDPDGGVGVAARTIVCKSRKDVPITPNVIVRL